jgi:hypothetical protein
MKRTLFLTALVVLSALPALAQSNEAGVIVGGSRLFVDNGQAAPGGELGDATFSFSNNSVELFWARQLEPDTWLRLKLGRVETPIPMGYDIPTAGRFRRDVRGEVQHAELNVEYRFSEPYGQTGIFAGAGLYQLAADGFDTESTYGFNAGITADFPITRRYGFVLETAYHWTRAEFRPRYLTLGGGLRVSF